MLFLLFCIRARQNSNVPHVDYPYRGERTELRAYCACNVSSTGLIQAKARGTAADGSFNMITENCA